MPKSPTQKSSDITNKNKSNSIAAVENVSWAAARRRWLIAAATLVVIAGLIAGALYFKSSSETAAPVSSDPAKEPRTQSAAPGPWGHLTLTPIIISPPLEYVAADWGRNSGPDEWYFPGTSLEVMDAFLSAHLSPEQVSRIRATARPDPRTKGLIVRPDPEMVRSFSPQERAGLYLELGKTSLNFDQANAFRFYGSSPEEWLRGSRISPRTRQLVEPLIYSDGDFLLFADPEAIRSQVKDAEELRRLAKTLLRQPTMLVELAIKNDSEIAGLADYWGRGGRRTDLRPILESVAEKGPDRSIDIIHLLPTLARNHLYRYPRLTAADLDKPLIANCLWTALNFFSARPDDRFLDVNVALNTLKRDYFIVETGFQLGDIIVFLDQNGNLFHVVVYLADGLVFTKNGTSPMAPWVITTLDQVKGYYRARSSNPRLMYHRRNDL